MNDNIYQAIKIIYYNVFQTAKFSPIAGLPCSYTVLTGETALKDSTTIEGREWGEVVVTPDDRNSGGGERRIVVPIVPGGEITPVAAGLSEAIHITATWEQG